MDDKSTPISSLNNNVNVENDSGVVNQILNKYNNLQDSNQDMLPPPNKNITAMENDFENRNLNQELYNLKANNVQYKDHHDKEVQRVSSHNQKANSKQEIYEEEDREIMEKYEESWRAIFEAAELDDIYEEISWQSLKDPKSKVTKLVLFLYSMETFIPYELNRASREQD